MNMHETYVSLEVAKLLKQAGFEWEVMSFYTNDVTEGCESEYELRLVRFDNWNDKNKIWCDLVSAPTLDVAQRWLREVKNISVNISSTPCSYYEYTIRKINQLNYKDNTILALTACRFYTYEGAQEAGIKKCLEIILEK